MSYNQWDNKNSEILQYEIKKILEKHPEEDGIGLQALLVEAIENRYTLPGEDLQHLLTCFQSVLIAIDRQNQSLEGKLYRQARELIRRNQVLKKKNDELDLALHRIMERDAKLTSIFNAAVEGIITIDRFGIVITVNAAVKTIFGYSAEELIGHNINKIMPIEQSKKHGGYIENYLRTRIPKVIGSVREVEGMRKDGSSVYLDFSLAEFIIDGETYFTGILRDASHRKLQDKQGKERLNELAHVARLGQMSEMASGIAHEVNQPLTAISAYIQVSMDLLRSGNADLKQLVVILDKANQQALRAGDIIHRMRDFAKSKTFVRSSVDINELIRECLNLFEFEIKQYGITQEFQPYDDLPVAYIDEVQIEQVLLNLIKNSIDALKTLKPPLTRILTIRACVKDRHDIEISVKDNGAGIPESEQEKILRPFYTTKTNGTGMGLSISRSIIEAHHGVLHFNSEPGKGSIFYLTIPLRKY